MPSELHVSNAIVSSNKTMPVSVFATELQKPLSYFHSCTPELFHTLLRGAVFNKSLTKSLQLLAVGP